MPGTNLSLELTSLVGRDHELEELRRLVCAGARFVTLTGPGGSGKTRLGREAVRSLAGDFSDGAFLVSLAPIRDADYVASVIAQTLELRETGSEPALQGLRVFLAERSLLLMLDNFEQVIDAGPLIVDLLGTCPRLQVLVTSRSALRVSGEREFPVPPLAIPDPRHLPESEALLRYASVGLFLDRARAVNPNLQTDAALLRDVARICARLDGLPLAIELAAARTKLLNPAAMLARFQSGLAVLTGGARDLPERQRTLHDAIAWSYNLLNSDEQAIFRLMSVFSGGCNLESAEAVFRESTAAANRRNAPDILENIASLVDKNLARQADGIGSRARFSMLETIREFGIEMLAECGELDFAQRRHAEHLLLLAEEASENIPGPAQEHWLQTLEQEHDNLRAALRWLILHDEAASAMRMAAALEQFWQFHGYILEGHGWLCAVLEADRSGATTPERAKALTSLGMLELYRSDYDGAQRSHEQALAIYRAIDDKWNVAVAVNDLGTVALYRSDYAAARRLFEESLELRRQLGDMRGSAVCLTNLGIVAQVLGDLEAARGHHERSLDLRRQLGDAAGIARSLTRLGAVATEQHDHGAAQDFLREALMLSRKERDDRAMASSLSTLGTVAVELGNVSEAKALLEEGLAIRRRIGDRTGILRSLWHLLKIAEDEGDLSRARALWEEGLPIQHETADMRGMALWQAGLGDLLVRQGDYETAQSYYERSLALRRQIGDEPGAAVILGRLAQMSLQKGDASLARHQLQDSVEGLRGAGDAQALTAALTNLAQIVAGFGDVAESESLYKEALSLQYELDNLQVIVLCLSGLALSAHVQGDCERAARLKGAVSGLRSAFDTSLGTAELRHVSDAVDLDAGDLAISEAWASGQALTLQDAVAYALSDAVVADDRDEAASLPDGLSKREAEVLALMAAGRSNPEIAAELFISVNTVYRHVSHIFAKTGTSNRVEAATYARSHGLTSTVSGRA